MNAVSKLQMERLYLSFGETAKVEIRNEVS